jgi:hypothetical protein
MLRFASKSLFWRVSSQRSGLSGACPGESMKIETAPQSMGWITVVTVKEPVTSARASRDAKAVIRRKRRKLAKTFPYRLDPPTF